MYNLLVLFALLSVAGPRVVADISPQIAPYRFILVTAVQLLGKPGSEWCLSLPHSLSQTNAGDKPILYACQAGAGEQHWTFTPQFSSTGWQGTINVYGTPYALAMDSNGDLIVENFDEHAQDSAIQWNTGNGNDNFAVPLVNQGTKMCLEIQGTAIISNECAYQKSDPGADLSAQEFAVQDNYTLAYQMGITKRSTGKEMHVE